MLGYVRLYKPDLLIKEFQRYQSVYCAVCKSMGRQFGQLKRLGVSYDAAFLALFFLAFKKDEKKAYAEACVANPLKKRAIAAADPLVDFAAAMTCYLAYESGLDHMEDRQWLKGIPQTTVFASAARKIRLKYPELCSAIEKELRGLADFERREGQKAGVPSEMLREDAELCARNAAAFNGRILAAIFVHAASLIIPENPDLKGLDTMFETIGQSLGEWVYLMDAWEDCDKDIKARRFNPFARLGEAEREELAVSLLKEREENLDRHAALLPYYKDAAIVQNIICQALPEERCRVRKKEKQRKL